MDVSFIIVNYNTKDQLYNCITSIIEKTNGILFEIIVVDNASVDGSIELLKSSFADVRIIANKDNLGFGKANNLGAKQAIGKYLFFLNSDTILINNACLSFFERLENNPKIASCGGNLIFEDGSENISYGNFPTLSMYFFNHGFKKIFKKYYNTHLSAGIKVNGRKEPFQVSYVCGADIFVRKNVFDEMKGFNEAFFLYFEETDLYKRMANKGYKSIIYPEIDIIHLSGQSAQKIKQLSNDYYHISKFRYVRMHSGVVKFFFIFLIDIIYALWLRLIKNDSGLSISLKNVIIDFKNSNIKLCK